MKTKCLFLLCASGCMLGPTDDQRVTAATDVLQYWGYTTRAGGSVQVRAWDFTANAMVNVGVPAIASSSPTHAGDMDVFRWSTMLALPARFWRTGPAGGQCAVVGGRTTVDGTVRDVMTVESDWGSCYTENPSASEFYTNCESNNNPIAKIYTQTWTPIAVSAGTLGLAGLAASPAFSITLDNYTPTAYEFCSASTPEGCPPGGASDPETWKYYKPNGSSLTFAGSTMTFSIPPSRSDPMTIYLDDMSNVSTPSSRLSFRTAGNRFILRINFESTGPEVRMNCIRNGLCAILDGQTRDLTSPLFADLSFVLGAEDGRVTYSDVTTTVSNGSPDGVEAANSIAAAINEKLLTDPAIRASVSAALDSVVRGAASLDPFPLDGVSVTSGVLRVTPGCLMD